MRVLLHLCARVCLSMRVCACMCMQVCTCDYTRVCVCVCVCAARVPLEAHEQSNTGSLLHTATQQRTRYAADHG